MSTALFGKGPLQVMYASKEAGFSPLFSHVDPAEFKMEPFATNDIYALDEAQLQRRGPDHLAAVFLEESDPVTQNYEWLGLWDTRAPDLGPCLMRSMNEAVIRKAVSKPSLTITVTNQPWPPTYSALQFNSAISGFISSMIFTIAMSFIPASNIVFLVKERTEKIKHQQIVSGVSLWAYWSANFTIDYLKYLFPGIFTWLMCKAFGIESLVYGYYNNNWGGVLILQLLYGTSMITFTYFFHFFFKEYSTAQVMIFGIFFLVGSIGGVLSFILRLIPSTRNYMKVISWFVRPFPSYAYGYGLINIQNAQIYALIEGYQDIKQYYDLDLGGGDFLMMGVFTIVYMVLIALIEIFQIEVNFRKMAAIKP